MFNRRLELQGKVKTPTASPFKLKRNGKTYQMAKKPDLDAAIEDMEPRRDMYYSNSRVSAKEGNPRKAKFEKRFGDSYKDAINVLRRQ